MTMASVGDLGRADMLDLLELCHESMQQVAQLLPRLLTRLSNLLPDAAVLGLQINSRDGENQIGVDAVHLSVSAENLQQAAPLPAPLSHSWSNTGISFYAFDGHEVKQDPRSRVILEYLAPYLHEAWRRDVHYHSLAAEVPVASFMQQPLLRKEAFDAVPAMTLTPREQDVLHWVMRGKTNWEIAQLLAISERTVKFHLKNILAKLNASSRAHAVAIALHRNLIAA